MPRKQQFENCFDDGSLCAYKHSPDLHNVAYYHGPLRGHRFDMGTIFAPPPPMQAGLHGFAHPAKYDFRAGP